MLSMFKSAALIAILIATSSTVLAQSDNQRKERSPSPAGSRDTRFEVSLILAYQNGLDESSEGGSSIDVDSAVGWGIGLGWNWTEKLNLSYRFVATKPGYLAVVARRP